MRICLQVNFYAVCSSALKLHVVNFVYATTLWQLSVGLKYCFCVSTSAIARVSKCGSQVHPLILLGVGFPQAPSPRSQPSLNIASRTSIVEYEDVCVRKRTVPLYRSITTYRNTPRPSPKPFLKSPSNSRTGPAAYTYSPLPWRTCTHERSPDTRLFFETPSR